MISQRIDDWGRVIQSEQSILELFYNGVQPSIDLLAPESKSILEYNSWCKTFDKADNCLELAKPLEISPNEFHEARQSEWMMPEKYLNMDIAAFLFDKCTTKQQSDRVSMELALFDEHRMVNVLRLLVYIVDVLLEHNVLWGVGRGSSVASYVLFLIGIHRIDSLEYDLDIREFLKG